MRHPMLAFQLAGFALHGWTGKQLLRLTARAVRDVCAEVLAGPELQVRARLDPADVRWLETMRSFAW